MLRVIRFLIIVTYPFLGLSLLLLMGQLFGQAFTATFTISNQTGQTLIVTPVGTVGAAGYRRPLPTVMSMVPLPAPRAGGFRLEPQQSVAIYYDMDDINFSEIVVEDESGRLLQMIVDPNPTTNQYHGPTSARYAITNLADLSPAPPAIVQATLAANQRWKVLMIYLLFLAGPWCVYGALRLIRSKLEPKASGDLRPQT